MVYVGSGRFSLFGSNLFFPVLAQFCPGLAAAPGSKQARKHHPEQNKESKGKTLKSKTKKERVIASKQASKQATKGQLNSKT